MLDESSRVLITGGAGFIGSSFDQTLEQVIAAARARAGGD